MSESAGGTAHLATEPVRTWPRWQGFGIPLLSFLGMLVAGYLTWLHWSGSRALCAGVGDCETVQNSPYAEVAGIPVALLGLGMYAALFGLALYRRRAHPEVLPALGLAIFGISLAGVLYSAYLTYIELAVIHAICPWCVTSAVLITLIFALSVREVVAGAGQLAGAE
jgi:uncharacterized membrane protein